MEGLRMWPIKVLHRRCKGHKMDMLNADKSCAVTSMKPVEVRMVRNRFRK